MRLPLRPGGPDPTVSQHYFSERPTSSSRPLLLRFLYRGELLTVETDRGVFASQGLDPGTALLIELLDPAPRDRILDLGCGWGAIGLAAAKASPEAQVILTDVNQRALRLARRNLTRNGVRNAEVRTGSFFAPVAGERFDLILTHPPYHVGREMLLQLLDQTPGYLEPNGRLLLVGKGSQGVLYYQTWLRDHWSPGVRVRGRRSGYRVLEARPFQPSRAR